MTLIILFLALVMAASFKHGGKMFLMCMMFFFMDRSCESESIGEKIAADKRACQLADFPDAVGVKLYRDGKFEGVYSVLCIDAKGGLHMLPK